MFLKLIFWERKAHSCDSHKAFGVFLYSGLDQYLKMKEFFTARHCEPLSHNGTSWHSSRLFLSANWLPTVLLLLCPRFYASLVLVENLPVFL